MGSFNTTHKVSTVVDGEEDCGLWGRYAEFKISGVYTPGFRGSREEPPESPSVEVTRVVVLPYGDEVDYTDTFSERERELIEETLCGVEPDFPEPEPDDE